ncbi:MAG TPA: hypothetical protein VFU03_01115 [Gemmatimonadales bacterium]|nr:hypothetical protein [Gemmatimonadales bacterium]
MRRLIARLQALIAAIVLVAGGALPMYDAVCYHGARVPDLGPVRIEAATAGTAHLLTCTLGRQFQRSRGVLPQPTPTQWLPSAVPVTPLPPPSVAPPAPAPTLQRSRAPPVPIA